MPKSGEGAGQDFQNRLLRRHVNVGDNVGPALEGDLLVGVPPAADYLSRRAGGFQRNVQRAPPVSGVGQSAMRKFGHIILMPVLSFGGAEETPLAWPLPD